MNSERGCTIDKCACVCSQYPKCGCGAVDEKAPIEEPAPAQQTITGNNGEPTPLPTTTPTFVLMNYPTDGKGEVIFIGRDKGKAFDKLMEYGKKNPCQVADLQMVGETD